MNEGQHIRLAMLTEEGKINGRFQQISLVDNDSAGSINHEIDDFRL